MGGTNLQPLPETYSTPEFQIAEKYSMLDKPKRLMIVDDDVMILSVLPQCFSELGYYVRAVESGSSALSEIERELPDILLSDLNMPGIPGTEFLLMVRRIFPSIRVVAMSGAFSGTRVPAGIAADAFYEKGSSLCLLTRAIAFATQPPRTPPSIQHAAHVRIPDFPYDPILS
jgi:CheY-like chemotaxis protein